ncbi:hypothetical protein AZL_f01410 (plasmid) [Azospirillum sp. B510]|uniref:DUF4422 domain-containing protein n=1 Tax=Azospirillum sp. (strain B510) TaxID=137722 RepID=UPI0001C4CD2B|nr:DUF4422 domain-containing protein [Azospirillum sp. B510]BAI76901.1 hypothetical protein AZL_f01410 [Azospirillum sp. B510]
MRIGIFTVHHKEGMKTPQAYPFIPFMVGCSGTLPSGFFGDNMGRNLQDSGFQSASYGELRAHYSVWKNHLNDFDVVGFQHYRRFFFFDTPELRELFPEAEMIRRAVSRHPNLYINFGMRDFERLINAMNSVSESIARSIKNYTENGIVCTQRLLTGKSIASFFREVHKDYHWDIFSSILQKRGGKFSVFNYELENNFWAPYCTMFMMKSSIFSDIMETLFDVMREVELEFQAKGIEIEGRDLGYIAERLIAVIVLDYVFRNPESNLFDLPMVSCLSQYESGIYTSVGRAI